MARLGTEESASTIGGSLGCQRVTPSLLLALSCCEPPIASARQLSKVLRTKVISHRRCNSPATWLRSCERLRTAPDCGYHSSCTFQRADQMRPAPKLMNRPENRHSATMAPAWMRCSVREDLKGHGPRVGVGLGSRRSTASLSARLLRLACRRSSSAARRAQGDGTELNDDGGRGVKRCSSSRRPCLPSTRTSTSAPEGGGDQ